MATVLSTTPKTPQNVTPNIKKSKSINKRCTFHVHHSQSICESELIYSINRCKQIIKETSKYNKCTKIWTRS